MGLRQLRLWPLVAAGLFALLLTTTPTIARAQIGTSEPLTIVLTPDTPGAFDSVSAKAESFIVDLQPATLTWTLDGKQIEKGVGKTNVQFSTGDLGKSMTLRVTAILKLGESISATSVLRPEEVDLVAESASYTHPFYKSKALLPASGQVTLIAIPHLKNSLGTSLDRNTLIYTWKDGAKVLGNLSGAGKHTITIEGPQLLRDKFIQLEVTSPDKTLRAKNTLILKPFAQKVALYAKDSLLGVLFNRAIVGSQTYRGSELDLIAFPYFFSSDVRYDPALTHSWELNGKKVANDGILDGILTLRPSGKGKATINYAVRSPDHILEQAGTRIDLSFEEVTSPQP